MTLSAPVSQTIFQKLFQLHWSPKQIYIEKYHENNNIGSVILIFEFLPILTPPFLNNLSLSAQSVFNPPINPSQGFTRPSINTRTPTFTNILICSFVIKFTLYAPTLVIIIQIMNKHKTFSSSWNHSLFIRLSICFYFFDCLLTYLINNWTHWLAGPLEINVI